MAAPRVALTRIQRKRGVVYRIDYRVNGKRIREVIGSNKRNAELIRSQRERDLLLGQYNLPDAGRRSITLGNLIAEFLQTKKNQIRRTSYKRYQNYFSPLASFFSTYFPAASADVRTIQPKYLHEFVDHMLNGTGNDVKRWSRKTANGAILVIKSLFKYAKESKYIDEDPAKTVKEMRLPEKGKADYFTDEELQRIWEVLELHWRPCLEFTFHTGLRKAEMINLQWSNVNLTAGNEQITIASCDEWETKTGNSRTIPLNPRAIEIIKGRLGIHPTYVFTSPLNRKIHPDRPYHALRKALKALGLIGDVHKLRHTFASKLSMDGVDLNAIKELLGHTDIETTQIYVHNSPQHLSDAVNRLVRKKPSIS